MTPICFPFLALPAELRIQIYRLLLICAQPSTIYTDSVPYILANSLHTAVLYTCKSIHAEAEDLLYDYNTFRIDLRRTEPRHPQTSFNTDASYLPLFIQYIPEVCKRGEHYPNSDINVVQRGVLTHNTLRRMKHLEIVTDHDTHELQFMMTDPLCAKGQLFLEILRVIGDSEVVTKEPARQDRQRASLRICIEHKRLNTRAMRPIEQHATVLKVLQKVLARRMFDFELNGEVIQGNWYNSNLTISDVCSTEYFIELFQRAGAGGR